MNLKGGILYYYSTILVVMIMLVGMFKSKEKIGAEEALVKFKIAAKSKAFAVSYYSPLFGPEPQQTSHN